MWDISFRNTSTQMPEDVISLLFFKSWVARDRITWNWNWDWSNLFYANIFYVILAQRSIPQQEPDFCESAISGARNIWRTRDENLRYLIYITEFIMFPSFLSSVFQWKYEKIEKFCKTLWIFEQWRPIKGYLQREPLKKIAPRQSSSGYRVLPSSYKLFRFLIIAPLARAEQKDRVMRKHWWIRCRKQEQTVKDILLRFSCCLKT